MSDILERLRYWGKSFSLGMEAADEIEKLREALRLAVDAVEHWASYASPYFQEKHDLAGDLQELREALGEKE